MTLEAYIARLDELARQMRLSAHAFRVTNRGFLARLEEMRAISFEEAAEMARAVR